MYPLPRQLTNNKWIAMTNIFQTPWDCDEIHFQISNSPLNVLLQITTHLQNLPNLKVIGLQDNSISELSNTTFVGTTNVEDIYLQTNILENLKFLTSQTVVLSNLKTLDVSQNQLVNLPNFVSAPTLRVLRMDGGDNSNRWETRA